MSKKGLIIFLGIIVFGFFALGIFRDNKSSMVLAQSGISSDAIAVRIIPNIEHKGVARWYKEQGFKGSPQTLTVDGYDAIRDGRTVYVNVANVVVDTLYTNIYLISYNQDVDKDTMSILDQIISHWKFNINDDINATNGECSKTVKDGGCLLDIDCPSSEYCKSQKAKIIRDTKRLAELADMKTAIENYKKTKGYYPKLSAGTYLVGKTVSTWPSWQQTLAKDLGASLPFDPINKLGACSGFNDVTCWNESTKSFVTTPSDGSLSLPSGSNAFVYASVSDGLNYNVCGVMESGYVNTLPDGACSGSAAISGVVRDNNPATITCGELIGEPNKPFKGYVSASDPDGDPLDWTISLGGIAWSNPLDWRSTVNPSQKEIYSSSASSGNYIFTVTVNDGRIGGLVNKMCTIKIKTVAVAPTCSADGCNGVCPTGCTTSAQDPDCGGGIACYGNGKCEPATDCTAGVNDCTAVQCCNNDGTCDLGAREDSASCSSDCLPATNACTFNFNFPCTF